MIGTAINTDTVRGATGGSDPFSAYNKPALFVSGGWRAARVNKRAPHMHDHRIVQQLVYELEPRPQLPYKHGLPSLYIVEGMPAVCVRRHGKWLTHRIAHRAKDLSLLIHPYIQPANFPELYDSQSGFSCAPQFITIGSTCAVVAQLEINKSINNADL